MPVGSEHQARLDLSDLNFRDSGEKLHDTLAPATKLFRLVYVV